MDLLGLLLEPKLRGVDLQGFDRIALHAEILAGKPLIREVFTEFYRKSVELDQRYFAGTIGIRVELGAGTSLFKKCYPDVISTDVQPAPNLDAVIDAQNMALQDDSVRALFCINCFHHFPDPRKFFAEVLRVVKPGGGCVIIDPYSGMLAQLLYRRLFASEAYDRDAQSWGYSVDEAIGPSRPNQALSYVVFSRDQRIFEDEFPNLEIVSHYVFPNYTRYLLSGGLNFRQLVPTFFAPVLRVAEAISSPLSRFLGLHHAVVLRKRRRSSSSS
jgi:SAM-dependent methyltransferase